MTRARLMERIITGAPKAVMEKSACLAGVENFADGGKLQRDKPDG